MSMVTILWWIFLPHTEVFVSLHSQNAIFKPPLCFIMQTYVCIYGPDFEAVGHKNIDMTSQSPSP